MYIIIHVILIYNIGLFINSCVYYTADLIMLGLATHEPYFTILREEFKPNTPRPCEICNQIGETDYQPVAMTFNDCLL